MERSKTKAVLTTAGIILALGGLGLYFYNPSKDFTNTKNQTEEIQKNDIKQFFRDDLNENEKKELENALKNRDEKLKEMKNILDAAYKKGDMENAWLEVNKMRDEIKASLLSFIKKEKLGDFQVFCYKQAEEFDSYYIQK